MAVITNHEVRKAEKTLTGKKKLVAIDRQTGKEIEIVADEILVASGRGPNTDVLHPEKGGIRTDEKGWIMVNEYWRLHSRTFGPLKIQMASTCSRHVANHESMVAYHNAVLRKRMKVDYHAVPHAVFTYPEIASVGLKEKEAIERHGKDNVLIGIQRYEDTAKGLAMGVKDCFVKVIVENETLKILGAHIIGPCASILIHEIINLMYTPSQSAEPIMEAMHIHPALSEAVQRAFRSLMSPEQYHHVIEEHYKLL